MSTQESTAKARTKKSRRLVSAGVFIALYFVVFMLSAFCTEPVGRLPAHLDHARCIF